MDCRLTADGFRHHEQVCKLIKHRVVSRFECSAALQGGTCRAEARRYGPTKHRLGVLLGLWLCVVIPVPPVPAASQQETQRFSSRLNARIEAILQSNDAFRGSWGIEVAELPSGKILFHRDAQRLFHPASNMKLFTTAAALEKLGPGFIFRTTVESVTEPDVQGRVPGVFLIGRGDPTFEEVSNKTDDKNHSFPALRNLAVQLKARGVSEITGTLVADDSYFVCEPYSPGWAADDLLWGYAAPISALAFNGNALQLRIRPGIKTGDRAEVRLVPLPDYYHLNNRLETGAAGTESRFFVERGIAPRQLDIWGKIPLDAREITEQVAIIQPQQLVGELFRQALEDTGIRVRGSIEVRQVTRAEATGSNPLSPAGSQVVLAEHDSLPLSEIVKATNKESRNFYAETLLRTLAREVRHSGSREDGLEVLSGFSRQTGARPSETVFADGSGLSWDNLVTPDSLVKLLIYMARSPAFNLWRETLPLAGADGTLAGRFQGTRIEKRVRAKTGTKEQTNALSGYMELSSGKRLAFSIVGNNHALKARDGAAIIDQIVLAIYDSFSRHKR